MIRFHIITLFPESIKPYLESSIIGRAQAAKKIKISYYNPIEFTGVKTGKLARLDWRPYGGGPGMVLRPEPTLKAAYKAIGKKRGVTVIFFSTDGELFTEAMAKKLADKPRGDASRLKKDQHVVLICGHYEGVDERVPKILKAKKVSMGPYVLTGGELPAATLIDAVARHVPGVLGKAESLEASRVSSPEVYTRPEVLVWKKKKYRVPKVLLTGHHAKIEEWKSKKRQK